MSKFILSRFKKSLGQSSNIISESRISSSPQRDLNLLEGIEKTPEVQRQYIDKSSLTNTYRNSHDHNKLIKKIPQLISENDELKEKVKKMEEQLAVILQAQRKRSSFSFRQEIFKEDEDIVKSSMHKQRTSKLDQSSQIKSNRYSLDHYYPRGNSKQKYQEGHHSRFYKEPDNEEMILIKEKIYELEILINNLKRQNRQLKQQNTKLNNLKYENSKQIDMIMAKFQQTLKNKEDLSKIQANLLQQKLTKIKNEIQIYINEKNKAQQECEKLKKLLQLHINHQNFNQQMREANLNYEMAMKQLKQRQAYKLSQTVQHLWHVKDVQFNNLIETLRFTRPNLV